MNLKHLEYFRILAKLEHYTQASEELSITQPTLTYAISELEKELGAYLFEKSGRNIRLTKYGSFFLRYVDSALNELEKGEKELRELVSPIHGKIDLAFIYTLGPHLIPSMIKAFFNNETHKNITFSFNQKNTKSIIKGLKDEKYDLAFCSLVEDESDIEFIPLVKQKLVLVVSSNHPLAAKDSIDLKETLDYPFISFNKESGLRPLIDNLFKKVNISPNIICEVEEDNALAGLVSINYGIAVVPNIWVLKHFDIKILDIINPPHERFIYMATVKNRYLSPTVHLFRNFVINYSKNVLSNEQNTF